MKTYAVVLGAEGVRMAESLVYACAAGLPETDVLRLTVVGAPEEAAVRLRSLAADYAEVRGHYGLSAHLGFGPILSCRTWPEAQPSSLSQLCEGPEDCLLRQALFTHEEAAGEALNGSGPAAAVTWARLLSGQVEGSLAELAEALKDRPEDNCLVLGSLCEPVCAAGLPTLLPWLKKQLGAARLGLILATPLRAGEDAGLCREALRSLPGDAQAAWLIGLPEDCRAADERPHLAEWLSTACVDAFLRGAEGRFACRVPDNHLSWAAFGAEEARFRQCYTRFFAAALLMLTVYDEPAIRALQSPNWLKDRLRPWYAAWFSGAGRMSEAERGTAVNTLQALERLLGSFAAWLGAVQETLPYPMRLAAQLAEAKKEAEAHYEDIRKISGQLALMRYDAEKSGIAGEQVVHRYSMEDTEAEAALKEIDKMQELLLSRVASQEEYNRRLGGRTRRRMMEEMVARCRREAEDVRAQVNEARRRIDRAAEVATPEEMSRVDTARARLGRMERRLALLDGSVKQAELDLKTACDEQIRLRPPQLEEGEAAVPCLFDGGLLSLMARVAGAGGRSRKPLAQQLEGAWPWPAHPLRMVAEQVTKDDGRLPGSMPVVRLLDRVMEAAGEVLS